MRDLIGDRRALTDNRVTAVQNVLARTAVSPGTACVYATGSVARGEASEHSDLDLFILDTADESMGDVPLSNISGILLKADLIRASEEAGFPRFSGDGAYLETHVLDDLIRRTGRRDDDYHNSFTARLLLILESRVILNAEAHETAKARVIASYWRDYEDNSTSFRPVFLANDIVRYWKTLGVNYEVGRTARVPSGIDSILWRNRSRYRNIKLKFSRLLTCHSTLAYLLWASAGGKSISPGAAARMMSLTPLERLEAIAASGTEGSRIMAITTEYEWFLDTFGGSKEESFAWLDSKKRWLEAKGRGGVFADSVRELLDALGDESPLYRFLLV